MRCTAFAAGINAIQIPEWYQNPNKTSTLIWYYQNYLTDYILYEEIGEEIGMEAKPLQLLQDCDTVVMLVSRDRTRNMTVGNAVRLLQEGGKNTAGFIFVY